ncbi:MAG TPA: PilZ domain-containing protein [Alkalispirochaeta sp.]|nr:PilZ domain-containing protein [Alkalispirochaeta sp.]
MFLELSQGFRTSPGEVILVFAVVLAFILVPTVYGVRRRRGQERRRVRRAAERYDTLVEQHALSPSEQGAVEVLGQYLNDPTRSYVVMQNQGVFNQTAALARDDEALSEGQISALRVRLGFAGSLVGSQPHASAEIPPGSGVLVLENRERPVHGRVLKPATSAFRVRLDENEREFVSGNPVEVVYQNSSGVFRFESGVLNRAGSELELEHSEQIETAQRREYYRRHMRLPVYVRSSEEDRRPVRSEFLDIGGGGASMVNPGERYEPGDSVELTFHPDSDSILHIPARVVRSSKKGTILHLSFENIRESSRDRIYRLLFREGAHRGAT